MAPRYRASGRIHLPPLTRRKYVRFLRVACLLHQHVFAMNIAIKDGTTISSSPVLHNSTFPRDPSATEGQMRHGVMSHCPDMGLDPCTRGSHPAHGLVNVPDITIRPDKPPGELLELPQAVQIENRRKYTAYDTTRELLRRYAPPPPKQTHTKLPTLRPQPNQRQRITSDAERKSTCAAVCAEDTCNWQYLM